MKLKRWMEQLLAESQQQPIQMPWVKPQGSTEAERDEQKLEVDGHGT